MTLTNEQIEALAKRLEYCRICDGTALIGGEPCPRCSVDGRTAREAAAALRQLAEERIPKPCCGEWNICEEQCLPLVQHLRERNKDLQDDYLRRNKDAADFAIRLRQLERECADNQRDDVWGWKVQQLRQENALLEATLKEIRAQQKEDFDRAAKLQEERDREDRLLRAGWSWHMTGTEAAGTLCYHWYGKRGLPGVWNPDRATAARLAEEKLEKAMTLDEIARRHCAHCSSTGFPCALGGDFLAALRELRELLANVAEGVHIPDNVLHAIVVAQTSNTIAAAIRRFGESDD